RPSGDQHACISVKFFASTTARVLPVATSTTCSDWLLSGSQRTKSTRRPSGEKRPPPVSMPAPCFVSRCAAQPSALTRCRPSPLAPLARNEAPSGDHASIVRPCSLPSAVLKRGNLISRTFFVLISMIQLRKLLGASHETTASLVPSGDQVQLSNSLPAISARSSPRSLLAASRR